MQISLISKHPSNQWADFVYIFETTPMNSGCASGRYAQAHPKNMQISSIHLFASILATIGQISFTIGKNTP